MAELATPAIPDTLLAGLEVAVPLRIQELRLMTPYERHTTLQAWRSDACDAVAYRGDILQFGSKRRGEAASVFNHLARGLAALAHAPGGVLFAGRHWCLTHPWGKQVDSIADLACTAGEPATGFPSQSYTSRLVETVVAEGFL